MTVDAVYLTDLAERLFAAFTAHDLDAVDAMLAPGATLTQNGNVMPWEVARPQLAKTPKWMGDHRYEEVRRVVGDHAVVEEHRVRSTTPKGVEIDVMACVVVRVDTEGRITTLDEYLDTGSVR